MKISTEMKKKVDKLYNLEKEKKRIDTQIEEERALLKDCMKVNKIDTIEGKVAKAVYSERISKVIDTKAYYEALDGDQDKFMASVTVRMNPSGDRPGATSHLGKEIIEALCAKERIPILKITVLEETKIGDVIESTLVTRQKKAVS